MNTTNSLPKVSIVIPTMTLELVQKCIVSIIKYTDLNNIEIIVVVQCPSRDKILEYTTYFSELAGTNIGYGYKPEQCTGPFKILWYENPLGAVVALNRGIEVAKGEYVLLLNDDCEILSSEKNLWLTTLLTPFSDLKMACTGPFRMIPILGSAGELSLSVEDGQYGFILFFCAMIRGSLFAELGLLDEDLRCGVDIDFCMKAKRKGYKIAQVPSEARLDTNNPSHFTGDFPIWHQAEATVHDYYGMDEWHKIMAADRVILEERYGTNKKKKISIVIPVYGDHLDDFQKCYNSIVNNTNMLGVEVIIIANGCPNSVKMFLDEIIDAPWSCRYWWFDDALGATVALNEGIKKSTGDIVILLNQDVIILGNSWLPMLLKPFEESKVGITGPLYGTSGPINRRFFCFFCVAIRKEVFNEIGMLDEIFNPGGFEDIDFCIRSENAGWISKQVPTQELYASENFKFEFPIYHIDHHGEWMSTELHDKNFKIVYDRYVKKDLVKPREFIDITWPSAQKKYELEMVQEYLKNDKIERVLEIGSFRGGTAMLWSNIVKQYDGHVFCCDLNFDWGEFQGFGYLGKDGIIYNKQVYKDSPYEKYITEIKGDSHDKETIKRVKQEVGSIDLLFIDGDHSYDGVKQDFENYYSLVRIGGYIVIHDIIDSEFHRENGCYVASFWNEIKDLYSGLEFLDQNEYYGCPSRSMGIGIIKKESINLKVNTEFKKVDIIDRGLRGSDVICCICTKNRYLTTLPLAIQSVISQTIKPDKLIIYDDNTDEDRIDLRENEVYRYLFSMLDYSAIKWEVIFGLKQGQHHGHQIINKKGHKYVWRLDDDEIAAPDVIQKYLYLMKDDVGAVGGAVLTNGGFIGDASSELSRIYNSANVQWLRGDKVIEVEHLHSSFLYRAGIVDYCLELSPVAHREETIFSVELRNKGYKLLVDQSAVTHHLRQQNTGIRSHDSEWFYKHDERVFSKKMESWGYKLFNLNCGLGDHFAFLNILPKLKEKWKHLIIGACYPEVFKDHSDITLIHIAESEPHNDENIYKWMIDHNWKESIVKAYEIFYDVTT